MGNSWNQIILYEQKNLETSPSHLGQSTNWAQTPAPCHLVKFDSGSPKPLMSSSCTEVSYCNLFEDENWEIPLGH